MATGHYVYRYRPGHPAASRNGCVAEHILVAERMLGRPLRPNEVVHHINHVRDDNRPENLRVMDRAEHAHMHLSEGLAMCELNASGPHRRKPAAYDIEMYLACMDEAMATLETLVGHGKESNI